MINLVLNLRTWILRITNGFIWLPNVRYLKQRVEKSQFPLQEVLNKKKPNNLVARFAFSGSMNLFCGKCPAHEVVEISDENRSKIGGGYSNTVQDLLKIDSTCIDLTMWKKTTKENVTHTRNRSQSLSHMKRKSYHWPKLTRYSSCENYINVDSIW